MIQIRKSKDPEKKSEFPVVAMLWPGIGIAVGIACDTALKSIGWGITLGAIFGGVLLVVHLLAARTKKPGNQSSMTNIAEGHSGELLAFHLHKSSRRFKKRSGDLHN